MAHDLRVTERCWQEDLGLADRPPPRLEELRNRAISTFLDRRRVDPSPAGYEIGETRGELFKIRIGERERGATWFDQERNAVFLVAVDAHESRSEGDFYKSVPEQWRRGVLKPTVRDYWALQVAREQRWIDELRASVPSLRAEAEALATRGRATERLPVSDYLVRLAAFEIEGQFYYAICIEPRPPAPWVDYIDAIAIAQIVAVSLGLRSDLELRPIWRFVGAPVDPAGYAFDLG